jgi:hypothetical protein
MPNIAQNPSDIGRYAAHRLLGAIIDRCEPGLTRVMLFDQVGDVKGPPMKKSVGPGWPGAERRRLLTDPVSGEPLG